MHNIGLDIIEIARIEAAVERWGERFLRRIYTEEELRLSRNRAPALAVRFAAKEAVMKALGTGRKGVGWREIEVVSNDSGKPLVYLYGRAQKEAEELGLGELAISLSHSREYALASIIGGRIEGRNRSRDEGA
jgi:holo-[acyl-carrier protein] synthase